MFDPTAAERDFAKNRKSSLSLESQKSRQVSLKRFSEFCLEKYDEPSESVIIKLETNPNSAYQVLADLRESELKRGNSPNTIKLRFHYVKMLFEENGIKINDSSKIKDIFGKIPHHRREPVTHDELEKIILSSNKKLQAIIMIQSSTGMRISEVLKLQARDFTKKERYQINIRAETTKTKQGRITFLSKESEEFVEPFLENKEGKDRVFPYSKTGITNLFQRVIKKAGLEKRYDHTNCRTITSHSMRAFFITQMGMIGGVFGHSLAGHSYHMKEYDRFTPEELMKKYIEGEPNLQILNRVNGKNIKEIMKLQKNMRVQKEIISELREMLNESLISEEEWEEIKKTSPKLKVTYTR